MPFTLDQFFSVFSQYNEAIWPLPIAAYLAGIGVLGLLYWRSSAASVLIASILAIMWVVNGIGYHWLFFSEINPIAGFFAALFVLQAIALAAAPWLPTGLQFQVRRDARSITGLALAVFALVVYPLWGILSGQSYPAVPVFGLAPCPTTIFTIGLLLLGRWSTIRWLLIIPVIWSAIGGTGAVLLDIPQDFALIASLLIVLAFGVAHHGQSCRR